jgi:hypothetical protein
MGWAGFELLEIDEHGVSTRVAFNKDLDWLAGLLVTYDALPTVLVPAWATCLPDERSVVDSGPFDFAERARLVGMDALGATALEPGDLVGFSVGEVKWLVAEWWAKAKRGR